MKLRKFGAACLASAVMMTSAAVLAYADDAAAADSAATTDAAVAALTASGLTQEQVVDLIKTATTLKSREEIAAFLGNLESVKTILDGFEMDTIGDEDLGTLIASMSPEDLGSQQAMQILQAKMTLKLQIQMMKLLKMKISTKMSLMKKKPQIKQARSWAI